MNKSLVLLAVICCASIAHAFPGSSLLHKVTGGHSSKQPQQQTPGMAQPQQKKSFFGKIKSGVSHAVSAVQCTQATCSNVYQFTPQKANYCLGTEGKARTNIACARLLLSSPLAQNPAYAQAVHFSQIAMQKGAGGIGKLAGGIAKVSEIATCTPQKCGDPMASRNSLYACLGTPKKAMENAACANTYYQTHCAKFHFGIPGPLPHGMEFCNTIAQSRGQPPMAHPGMMPGMMHPGMIHPGMMNPAMMGAGCHGSITYTLPPGMPGQPMGMSSMGSSAGITAVNPMDTDNNPATPY